MPPLTENDEDRRSLARELHDDIGQRLALLADDADRLRRDLTGVDQSNLHRLDLLAQQARELAEDLRRLSHNLHPAIVDDLGLVPAIRSLVDDFSERSGIAVSLAQSEIPRQLPSSLATALYRITQEALRNVAKHAGDEATVEISLTSEQGQISLSICDSGIGFNSAKNAGLGLTSMHERALLAGGTFDVSSIPDQGTTIRVRLPFAKGHAQ